MPSAQAFEGFFTLVPILLVAVVSILLRARASRKRKQREDAAGGGSARGVPARGVPAKGKHGQGVQPRSIAAGGKGARDADRRQEPASIPAARGSRSSRADQFPRQRETSEVYPQRFPRTPSAGAPGIPQQPGGFPVTTRESYAYPPPLALNQADQEPAPGAGPRSTAAARQVDRSSAGSRIARQRLGLPMEARTSRSRERVSVTPERPSPKAAAVRGSSITARLERLPPLKRAVIWAEILGPPGGRQ